MCVQYLSPNWYEVWLENSYQHKRAWKCHFTSSTPTARISKLRTGWVAEIFFKWTMHIHFVWRLINVLLKQRVYVVFHMKLGKSCYWNLLFVESTKVFRWFERLQKEKVRSLLFELVLLLKVSVRKASDRLYIIILLWTECLKIPRNLTSEE